MQVEKCFEVSCFKPGSLSLLQGWRNFIKNCHSYGTSESPQHLFKQNHNIRPEILSQDLVECYHYESHHSFLRFIIRVGVEA